MKKIIVIDDDKFYLHEAKEMACEIGNVAAETYTPCELENNSKTIDFSSFDLMLLDYDLRYSTAIENKILDYAKKKGFKGKVFLWTLHDEFDIEDQKEIKSKFEGVISKSDLNVDYLKNILD